MCDLLRDIAISIELLEDGYQSDLSEEWHSVVMKDSATDLKAAYDEIEHLRGVIAGYRKAAKDGA